MPQLGLPIAVSDRLDRPKAERAIAALCHDLLSIAEVSAHLHLPLASSASWSGTWPTSTWSWSTGRPTPATVPTCPAGAGAVRLHAI
jgi:hypothetical protein